MWSPPVGAPDPNAAPGNAAPNRRGECRCYDGGIADAENSDPQKLGPFSRSDVDDGNGGDRRQEVYVEGLPFYFEGLPVDEETVKDFFLKECAWMMKKLEFMRRTNGERTGCGVWYSVP